MPMPRPPAANISPETVVVTIDGKAYTKAEFDAIVRNLPPDPMRNYRANPQGWLDQFALMNHLAKLAKEDGIDQREPFRQQLEYNILQFLAQAYIDVRAASPNLTDEEAHKWFEANKNEYKRAKVQGILVTWGGIPKEGEKARTDKEAQAIVDEIQKRAKEGESFADLVKKYSDDAKTRDKGGEFPLVRPEDRTLNRDLKSAIFTAAPGEVTRPVRLAGRFYIFKVVEFVDASESELRSEITAKIGQDQLRQWLDKARTEVKPEINSPAYFGFSDKPEAPPAAEKK